MAQVDFVTQLAQFARVTVDTCLCIYYLESGASAARRAVTARLFELAAGRKIAVDLPAIVRLEMLVHPLRNRDDMALAKLRRFSEGQPGVTATAIDEKVLFAAAKVRAVTSLKTPDALVVASAVAHGSEAIVGNDRDFEPLNNAARRGALPLPRYIHLDDHLKGA